LTIPANADVAPQNPGTPAVGYPISWVANSDPTRPLQVVLTISSNDGGPSGLHAAQVKFLFADPTLPPTANTSPFPNSFRLNGSNLSLPPLQSFAWNGVGNGLTLPAGAINPAFPSGVLFSPQGYTEMPVFSAGIIPPGGAARLIVIDAPSLAAGETMLFVDQFYSFHIDPNNPYE
jgi:hypothetical protein